MSNLEDVKVVLIVDGSSKLGASVARLFAKRSYKVAIAGINRDRLDKIAHDCMERSLHEFKVLVLVADLSDPISGETIVKKTIDHFGKLDVLINNAGIFYKTISTNKSSFDLYKKMMVNNVDAIVKASMEAVSHLEKTNGNIVFVSSVAAINPTTENYAYHMSKSAVSSYAKCLALDVAPKIRVNIISPEPTYDRVDKQPKTNAKMSPDIQQSDEKDREKIVNTIFYLASDDASFVNGAEFFLDRGVICKKPDIA